MESVIKKHLQSQYPFPGKEWIGLIFALFLLTLLITFFLEPFQVYSPEHKFSYFWICFFRATILALLATVYFHVIRPKSSWGLGKKSRHLILFLVLAGLVNFFIRELVYDNPNNWSLLYFWSELYHTFLIGIFISLILIPFTPWKTKPAIFPQKDPSKDQEEQVKTISIITQVKADNFVLPIDQFILARAEGNYTEIYTINNNKSHKQLKRIALKSLEEQLSHYEWIVKTHRAYLVNSLMVEKATGDAQGYQLTVSFYPDKIPVSRAYIPHYNKKHGA